MLFPFKYLFLGFEQFLKPYYKASVIGSILYFGFIFYYLRFHVINSDQEFLFYLLTPVFIVSIGMTLFSAPSTFAHSGVSADKIKLVVDALAKLDLQTHIELELLKKNIDRFKKRANQRVSPLKWIAGGAWATSIYFVTKNIEVQGSGHLYPNGYDLIPYLAFALVTYLFLASYQKANKLLFNALESGCDEFSQALPKE